MTTTAAIDAPVRNAGQGVSRDAGHELESSWDVRDEDPHAAALARTKTKTDAIRYAVGVLAGAPPARVMAWLAGYGISVSRSKVSPEVKAYRDAHGLTEDASTASGAPIPYTGHPADQTPAAGHGLNTGAEMPAASMPPAAPAADETDTVRGDDTVTAPVTVPDVTGNAADNRIAAALPESGRRREERSPWMAFACYAVAVVSLPVSLNTSWRFFDLVLHIPTADGERFTMFAVAELALVVCGAGMAVNVHRDGQPGSFRTIVWAMCAAMAYMAWAMSTPGEAIGRILLGPVLGTVMLHLGLGLALRARHQQTSMLARITRELRERCLSRLGLADDGRDAAQRTRDRKAYQAAALSRPRQWPWSRQARLERALLAAGVADDHAMRDRMLARLAVVRHASALTTLTTPSPW
ncbi:hypothetical protein [Mycobacterium avium]|uniref:hypothetical protein n=1 Tax=Mycobacterium avium TaxID=1764 RepID=UPI001CC70997|nr:hypothetical protein [Mycobacterium avium]